MNLYEVTITDKNTGDAHTLTLAAEDTRDLERTRAMIKNRALTISRSLSTTARVSIRIQRVAADAYHLEAAINDALSLGEHNTARKLRPLLKKRQHNPWSSLPDFDALQDQLQALA